MPEFWAKAKQQEQGAIARGLPAEGIYEFGRRWFDAWANQSVDELRDCMDPGCGFIDSSTFQNKRIDREETLANCAAAFAAFPDLAFYAQDGTNRSLPYYDYFEDQWRVVIPWRGIGRFTGPMQLPGTDVVVPPTGRCLNFIGVDRYTLTPDFKITHIDTDWDIVFLSLQMSPIAPSSVSLRTMKVQSLASRLIVPPLRFLAFNATSNEHRRFNPPLPAITSADEWRDTADRVERELAQARGHTSA
ncbi:nuclear transport factor 2 family protein [Mycobacterium koreense]|uniref:SnoaL-like domain-containing protein n=2 Tax=Mycolicibacillus koreensis TaxID=1069220 RepID=A0AA91PET4_9MYCO|nr:nuclear transport factor 2 family protein [Mycolicibacillus koreensis]OSC33962.1 hypothetical protein B8W67_08990 [Mycolicibacillus koreensis]